MTDRAKHWAKLLTAWERSGLSQVEYCRQQGLNQGTFAWWKRQLRATLQPAGRRLRVQSDSAPPRARADFVEVAWPTGPVAEAPASRSVPAGGSCGYEIGLANGRVIRLPRAFDPAAVAQLIAVVESC